VRRYLVSALALGAVICSASTVRAQTLGWPEATEALAQEKSKAQACVDLLKSVADAKVLAEVRPIYANAKATSDGVIAGLTTVLVKRAEPADLPHVRASLENAGMGLQQVCDAAAKAAQGRAGAKGPIDKIITDSIGPIIDALKSAVGGIWNYWAETRKIEREMILKQLSDAKWPDL